MASIERLNLAEPADFDVWRDYVHRRADSHVTDRAEWRLLYRELYGFEDYSYVCRREGRVDGALSLYHIRSPFMGKMLVSCPYFGYGGFYWDSDEARDALLAQALEQAGSLGVDYVELRLNRRLPGGFEANTAFAEFNLDLPETAEQTWKAKLSSNARQNVRKSRGAGLAFGLTTDHRACFDLLRRTLRAHGTPFHGERFFRLLTRHLGERVRFSEVRADGRLVAAGVVIRHGETIITPYIGSLARFRSSRPNYLQYWGLIEHCLETGVRRFEMGRSPRGSTHDRFKRKWGCDEMPLFYNYRVVNPRKPYRTVSEPSSIQKLATRAWRRLPLALTTAVGHRLYRYIP